MEITDNALEGRRRKDSGASVVEGGALSVSQLSMMVEEFQYLEILEYDTTEHKSD